MFVSYVVYGLRLAANIALPGLSPSFDSEVRDVQIWLKDWTTFPSTFPELLENSYPSFRDAEVEPNLRIGVLPGEQHFGLLYADGTRFAVDRRACKMWADWSEKCTLEDACTYLLGPVMGFVLRLRGTICLHASAVAMSGRAIALVGQPGAGKSTMAAAFACSGYQVISDDVVALGDKGGPQFFVQPGYPRVNLWPDSVRGLFGSEDALPRITPTWDKRYLTLGRNGHGFASSPLPLEAVYILDSRDETLTAPIIEEVSGKEAFMALVANTYVNYLLDQDMRRTEFDVLGRLVSSIPVRRVRPPAEPSALFNLCEAIAADAATAAMVRG